MNGYQNMPPAHCWLQNWLVIDAIPKIKRKFAIGYANRGWMTKVKKEMGKRSIMYNYHEYNSYPYNYQCLSNKTWGGNMFQWKSGGMARAQKIAFPWQFLHDHHIIYQITFSTHCCLISWSNHFPQRLCVNGQNSTWSVVQLATIYVERKLVKTTPTTSVLSNALVRRDYWKMKWASVLNLIVVSWSLAALTMLYTY